MPVCVADPSASMHCIEGNLHGQIAWVHRRQASMVIWDEPALLLVDSGLPSDTFNKVARARLTLESCSEEIGRVAGYFKAVGRPFAWWVGPSSRPLDIEERLQEMGFCATELTTGMRLQLHELREAPLPTGLQVLRVSSLRHLEHLSCMLAENWDPPDSAVAPFYQAAAALILQPQSAMRYFVAYLDGEPAAVSGLYLEGGVGGIYSVATRRQFRRRGIGARLTWAAADEARRAGAVLAVLQAAPEGKEIYQRLGFQDCCVFAEYTPAGQAAANEVSTRQAVPRRERRAE